MMGFLGLGLGRRLKGLGFSVWLSPITKLYQIRGFMLFRSGFSVSHDGLSFRVYGLAFKASGLRLRVPWLRACGDLNPTLYTPPSL